MVFQEGNPSKELDGDPSKELQLVPGLGEWRKKDFKDFYSCGRWCFKLVFTILLSFVKMYICLSLGVVFGPRTYPSRELRKS